MFQSVRGNVLTRLKKLDDGEYGGLILAAAGLKRLGLKNRISRYYESGRSDPGQQDRGFLQFRDGREKTIRIWSIFQTGKELLRHSVNVPLSAILTAAVLRRWRRMR